jgi:hypothetical protein
MGGHPVAPRMARPRPRLWRVILGFLVAPLAGGVCYTAIEALISWPSGASLGEAARTLTALTLYGGYPIALVVGVPAYLALRRLLRPRPLVAALAGGAVAVLPCLLILYWPSLAGRSPRAEGWLLEEATFLALVLAAGAAGGLAFWLCAAAGGARIGGRRRRGSIAPCHVGAAAPCGISASVRPCVRARRWGKCWGAR